MNIKEIRGIPNYTEILDLINAEWPEQFGKVSDADKVREMTESHNEESDTVKYLYDGGAVIGFYRYSRWPREEADSKTAHTLDVAVLPEKQRQGLGTLLMQDMIADCKARGYTTLLSRSFKDNAGSIRLHKALGFSLHLETGDSLVWEIKT